MLGKKILKLTTKQKKILHYYSTPPKNDRVRNSTLQFENIYNEQKVFVLNISKRKFFAFEE